MTKPLIMTETTYLILNEIINNPNQNQTQISKKINITFSQVNTITHSLQEKKLITLTKKGRTYKITPTPLGINLIKKINQINQMLNNKKPVIK